MTDLDTEYSEILILDLLDPLERPKDNITESIRSKIKSLGIGYRRTYCDSKEEVIAALEKASERAKSTKFLIHFTAHGSEKAIGNNTGLTITWQEVAELLEPINSNMEGELIVTVLACSGFSGYQMLAHVSDHPFYALIGPTRSYNGLEMIETSLELYSRLADQPMLPKVIEDMIIHFKESSPRIWVRSSHAGFINTSA